MKPITGFIQFSILQKQLLMEMCEIFSLFVLNTMLHKCSLVSYKLIMGFVNVHIF